MYDCVPNSRSCQAALNGVWPVYHFTLRGFRRHILCDVFSISGHFAVTDPSALTACRRVAPRPTRQTMVCAFAADDGGSVSLTTIAAKPCLSRSLRRRPARFGQLSRMPSAKTCASCRCQSNFSSLCQTRRKSQRTVVTLICATRSGDACACTMAAWHAHIAGHVHVAGKLNVPLGNRRAELLLTSACHRCIQASENANSICILHRWFTQPPG